MKSPFVSIICIILVEQVLLPVLQKNIYSISQFNIHVNTLYDSFWFFLVLLNLSWLKSRVFLTYLIKPPSAHGTIFGFCEVLLSLRRRKHSVIKYTTTLMAFYRSNSVSFICIHHCCIIVFINKFFKIFIPVVTQCLFIWCPCYEWIAIETIYTYSFIVKISICVLTPAFWAFIIQIITSFYWLVAFFMLIYSRGLHN